MIHDAKARLDVIRASVVTDQEFNGALSWAIDFFENIDSAGCSRSECAKARDVARVFARFAAANSVNNDEGESNETHESKP